MILTSGTSYQHNTVVIGLFGKLLSTAGFAHFAREHHVKCTGNVTNSLGRVGGSGYILLMFAVNDTAITGTS